MLTTDLFQRTLKRSEPGRPELQRIGFSPLSLEQQAADALKELRTPRDDDFRSLSAWLSRGVVGTDRHVRACVVLLRQGLAAQARLLYREASKLYPDPNVSFRTAIEQDLGDSMMVRAMIDCGHISVTRPELLAQFRAIVKNYPNSEHHAEAREMAGILAEMVAEDDTHARNARRISIRCLWRIASANGSFDYVIRTGTNTAILAGATFSMN